MASWMIHLRIAQVMLDNFNRFSPIPFIMGNLAPDSGVPSSDGITYIPDKDISHFAFTDELGKMYIHPQKFANAYLSKPLEDTEAQNFYMGYFAHLVTDRLWIEEIYPLGIQAFPELHKENKRLFAATIKRDWYDMDFQFLLQHPDFSVWHTYRNAPPFPNRYLNFFSPNAFDERKDFILDFYRRGVIGCEVRKTHLSPETLEAFIFSVAERVISLTEDMGLPVFSSLT